MKLNQKQSVALLNMGAFDYDVHKMANILDVKSEDLEKEINNLNSEVSKLLKKGQDMADYVIDQKLFEMAKAGDIKALDKLETRKKFK